MGADIGVSVLQRPRHTFYSDIYRNKHVLPQKEMNKQPGYRRAKAIE